MKNLFFLLLLTFVSLLTSCTGADEEEGFILKGAWTLVSRMNPEGNTYDYSPEETWLRIYDDSCYYECRIEKAPNGTMVSPAHWEDYTLLERGRDDYLYLQGTDTHPFVVRDDTTIVVQEHGCQYTWRHCSNLNEERARSIVAIIKNEAENPTEAYARYVFSNAEDQLQSENTTLTYGYLLVAIVLVAGLNFGYNMHRNKKRIEEELLKIKEERQALPQPIREAMNTVEQDFHQSDFYLTLRRRISNEERLTEEDWHKIEERLKSVYPRFTSTLLTLRSMSQVELQVCQLLKLHVPPTEIANVLCKDTSSISTIRSRLYKKVFGEKGSSKKWDEFIASL